MALSRDQIDQLIDLRITDELNRQNTAERVRDVLHEMNEAAFNPSDDTFLWGSISGNIEDQTDLIDYIESQISDASLFLLLSGTGVGAPITGDVEVDDAVEFFASNGTTGKSSLLFEDLYATLKNLNIGTGLYTQLKIGTGGVAEIKSTVANFAGLRYGGNYNTDFEDDSLVDKQYVDAAILSGSVDLSDYNSGADDIKLTRNFTGIDTQMYFSGTNINLTADYSVTDVHSYVQVNAASAFIGSYEGDGSVIFGEIGVTTTDINITGYAAKYTADYSAQMITDRFIPDIGKVNDLIDDALSTFDLSDYLLLAGGTMSGNILFAPSTGIDTTGAGALNIGGTNATIINIGRTGQTVNILGSTLYENVTNLTVVDKLITLNKGGAVTTGMGVGFEVEENAIITGYFKVNSARTGFDMLAPATAGIASFITDATSRTYTLPAGTGTIALTSDIVSTFSDSSFRIKDNGDATKQLAWEVSGITTVTTRTITAVDYSGTSVLSNGALTADRIPVASAAGLIDYSTLRYDGATLMIDTAVTNSSTAFAALRAGSNINYVMRIQNSNSGTTSSARILALNNSSNQLTMAMYSSAFTTDGWNAADAGALFCNGAGGLNIAASNAAGVIGFYTGSTTTNLRMSVSAAGLVKMGNSTTTLSYDLELNKNTTAPGLMVLNNSTTGIAQIAVARGTGTTGAFNAGSDPSILIESYGSSYVTNGMLVASTMGIRGSNSVFSIGTGTAHAFKFYTTNILRGSILSGGAWIIGSATAAISTELLSVQQDQNAYTQVFVSNPNAGIGAGTQIQSYNGTYGTTVGIAGTGATGGGVNSTANTGYVTSYGTGGLNVGTTSSSSLFFWTNNTIKGSIVSGGTWAFGQTSLSHISALNAVVKINYLTNVTGGIDSTFNGTSMFQVTFANTGTFGGTVNTSGGRMIAIYDWVAGVYRGGINASGLLAWGGAFVPGAQIDIKAAASTIGLIIGQTSGTANLTEWKSSVPANLSYIDYLGRFVVSDTTAATSSTAGGSIRNAGGFANAGSAYIGDVLYVTNYQRIGLATVYNGIWDLEVSRNSLGGQIAVINNQANYYAGLHLINGDGSGTAGSEGLTARIFRASYSPASGTALQQPTTGTLFTYGLPLSIGTFNSNAFKIFTADLERFAISSGGDISMTGNLTFTASKKLTLFDASSYLTVTDAAAGSNVVGVDLCIAGGLGRGNADGGSVLIRISNPDGSGSALHTTTNTVGVFKKAYSYFTSANIQFWGATANFETGVGVLYIGNGTTVPTAAPTAGVFVYAEGGALKGRGTSGTISTMAAADPHCEVCGSDFVVEYENEKYGYFAMCMKCVGQHIGHEHKFMTNTKGSWKTHKKNK